MPKPATAVAVPVSFVLSVIAVGLLTVYLTLMVSTIVFAALRTDLAGQVRDRSAEIARLESSYYDAIERVGSSDPATLGFVAPAKVHYVTEVRTSGLSFAR